MNRFLAGVIATLAAPPVVLYIARERRRLGPRSRPLTPREKDALRRHFHPLQLDRTRIVDAEPLPVPEPPLAGSLRRLGLSFPRVALVEAITFGHLIVSRPQATHSLLFHELVHSVQFERLGLHGFIRRYARGLLANGSYETIPLERCAFELEDRFRDGEEFDVESEVGLWIRADRF